MQYKDDIKDVITDTIMTIVPRCPIYMTYFTYIRYEYRKWHSFGIYLYVIPVITDRRDIRIKTIKIKKL